jgi:hypothetical protein
VVSIELPVVKPSTRRGTIVSAIVALATLVFPPATVGSNQDVQASLIELPAGIPANAVRYTISIFGNRGDGVAYDPSELSRALGMSLSN